MFSKKFNIVLLEDNKEDVQLICNVFKNSTLDHELYVVNDKESYSKVLNEIHPDLILA